MLAHYRAGRQSDALEAYRRARSALSEQIGLEPTPALRDLERRILNHDPALVPERPATLRRRRRRAAWRRWAAASAAAAIALAGATYALVGRDGSGPPSQLAPNSVGVIDAATGALSGELRLRSRPASLAYGSGSLWVAMQDDHTVLRVDPRTLAVERTIGIGAEPSHVAAASGIVWVLCSRPSRLFEIDGGTGTVVRSIGLAQRIRVGPLKGARLWPPISLAASPGAAWLSGGLGIVVRVDARTARTRQIAATSPEASGPLAYGAGAVWEPSLDGIARIDPRTLAVTTIPAPDVGYPQSVLGVAAAGNTPWVVSGENPVRGQSAWVVDIALRRVTRVIPLAAVPVAATATPGVLWTANGDGSIDRVDARTGEVRQIPVGAFPRTAYPVELAAGGGRVWAAVH
jgi:streptogramin lyase